MKLGLLAGVVALAITSAAQAQNIGEEGGWQFQSPNDRAVSASIAQLIELKDAGAFDAQGFPTAGGGGGSMSGSSAANTNNVFQFIDQSVTTNNCSSSGAVGSPISCGGHGGSSISGTSQYSAGNTNSATSEVKDNTFTSTGNTTNNNANVGDTITSTNGN